MSQSNQLSCECGYSFPQEASEDHLESNWHKNFLISIQNREAPLLPFFPVLVSPPKKRTIPPPPYWCKACEKSISYYGRTRHNQGKKHIKRVNERKNTRKTVPKK